MNKILVIKHGSLGDIISATSAFKSIRKYYNKDYISLLTTNKYHKIFEKCPFFDEVIIDSKFKFKNFIEYWKFIKIIKKKKFSLIIDLQNSERTMFYSFFFRFEKTIWNGTRFGSNIRYHYNRNKPPHVLAGLSNQIKLLGVIDNQKPNFDWNEADISNLNLNNPFFIINPGCSNNNPQKKWPYKSFAKIANYLISISILPVIIGSENDREVVEKIVNLSKGALNLINESPIPVIISLSKKAIGAISNDTGPAHLIASTGCKIHLVLSNFSKIDQVIPVGENVTFTQDKNINDIDTNIIIKELNRNILKK